MIYNSKCLWTFLLTTFISFLTEHICQCSPTFDGNPSDHIDEIPLDGGPAQNDDLKREWSKFASWGKRGFGDNFSVWGKRKWDNFHTWGKRDDLDVAHTFAQITPLKREWSKFASWGKRADSIDSDKRDWSSFQSWGKRNPEMIQDAGQDHLLNPDTLYPKSMEDKRKWGQLAVWGKRGISDDRIDADKRKWSKFASWGKRSQDEDLDGSVDMDKRKWAQLSTWGKRADGETDNAMVDKRAWIRLAPSGKRRFRQPWTQNLGAWGKRRWTGLNTWGKRSADSGKYWIKEVARNLLNLFDFNGDGALDVDELSEYIQTLMSLPSRAEMGGVKSTDDVSAKM